MSDLGTPRASTILTTTALLSTSDPFPLARGQASFQATVVSVGTGTSVISAIGVVSVSNDNTGYFPLGTLTALGTVAAAGTSTVTAANGFSSQANQPYRFAKVVLTTTAASSTVPTQTVSITQ